MPGRSLAVWVAAAGLAAGSVLAGESDDLRRWIDGPVRYIALKEEVQSYRALTTDAQRALFVERFWARRDPSPDTLTNEYRQRFWQRVNEANENFLDSAKPGWMTDRGKIHVLYGPPSEIQQDRDVAPNSSATSGRGVIRWIYEGRPADRLDLNPTVVVPFVRGVDGEYRLSYDPDLAGVFWDPLAIAEERTRAFDRFRELTTAPVRSQTSVMLDLGRMQEVPPQEKVLLESVETLESYETIPLRVKVDRFVDVEAGRPLVVVNVDLDRVAGSTKPAILARFTPADATRETRLLGEDSFRVESRPGYHVAQGRIDLDAGAYELTLIVADPVQVKTGVHRGRVEVPAPPDALRLSDAVWAAELEPVEYVSLTSHAEPFQVGPFRVYPKIESSYRRGDPLRLFFEVYGAQYPIRVRYQLEGRDDDGTWRQLGKPSTTEQSAAAVAWELATGPRWPPGEYRIRIEVVDAAQRSVTTDVPFELLADESR